MVVSLQRLAAVVQNEIVERTVPPDSAYTLEDLAALGCEIE